MSSPVTLSVVGRDITQATYSEKDWMLWKTCTLDLKEREKKSGKWSFFWQGPYSNVYLCKLHISCRHSLKIEQLSPNNFDMYLKYNHNMTVTDCTPSVQGIVPRVKIVVDELINLRWLPADIVDYVEKFAVDGNKFFQECEHVTNIQVSNRASYLSKDRVEGNDTIDYVRHWCSVNSYTNHVGIETFLDNRVLVLDQRLDQSNFGITFTSPKMINRLKEIVLAQ